MGIAMTRNPVGVNGIDPVRQGIGERSIEVFRSGFFDRGFSVGVSVRVSIGFLDMYPKFYRTKILWVTIGIPWRTGRMPFAPTVSTTTGDYYNGM